MNFTIRKATIEDASAILGLIKELAVYEKEPEAVVVTIKDLKQDGFGENPLFQTIIAEKEGDIVVNKTTPNKYTLAVHIFCNADKLGK